MNTENQRQTAELHRQEYAQERAAGQALMAKCLAMHRANEEASKEKRDRDTAMNIIAAMHRDDARQCWFIRDIDLQFIENGRACKLISNLKKGNT